MDRLVGSFEDLYLNSFGITNIVGSNPENVMEERLLPRPAVRERSPGVRELCRKDSSRYLWLY
jgi:hypothetical protein